MRETLYRAVQASVTALRSRLRPSRSEEKAGEAVGGGPTRLPFARRGEFAQAMNAQLVDSSLVIDDVAARLLVLRNHVVNLRNQLTASQDATEADWESVMHGFRREQADLQDGIARIRPPGLQPSG